jgi:predicted nucleotidyltransferase
MTRVEKVLHEVAGALSAAGQRFAVVGGLAVSARAEPRFTRDVDLAVAVRDDSEAEALVHYLVNAGYSVLATMEQDATKRLATVRLLPPGESTNGVVADLLFASSGVEPDLVAAAERIEILPGLTIPVALVGHLMALKVLAAAPERPQDLADLRALAAVADTADLELARQALASIEARGFARGKRLLEEFERLTHR